MTEKIKPKYIWIDPNSQREVWEYDIHEIEALEKENENLRYLLESERVGNNNNFNEVVKLTHDLAIANRAIELIRKFDGDTYPDMALEQAKAEMEKGK